MELIVLILMSVRAIRAHLTPPAPTPSEALHVPVTQVLQVMEHFVLILMSVRAIPAHLTPNAPTPLESTSVNVMQDSQGMARCVPALPVTQTTAALEEPAPGWGSPAPPRYVRVTRHSLMSAAPSLATISLRRLSQIHRRELCS
ncbi:hypothetical protein FKM82_023842 [Ascaphus truei]